MQGMPNLEEEKFIKLELQNLLEQEDLKWRQRAKVEWLRNRDQNTRYFHVCANQRNRRNKIEQILDSNGSPHIHPMEIEQAFVEHFQTILTTCRPTGIEECIAGIEGKVTQAMNNRLMARFTSMEVKAALDQMDPMKTPDPDGFLA